MNRILPVIAALAAGIAGAAAVTVGDIAAALETAGCYSATVSYTIVPPNATDDVTYTVRVAQATDASDTLSREQYLIDWTLTSPEQMAGRGFSAYWQGHHFRYRPGKMQEYHFDDEAAPFAPGGYASRGIQRQAQFVQLLPGFMAAELREMSSDPTAEIAVEPGRDGSTSVRVRQSSGGYDILTARYVFDSAMLPLESEVTYNPGQASEQTVSARYADTGSDCPQLSEEALIAAYPQEFERFRRDSYSLQSLPGSPLPTGTAPTLGHERWTHQAGEPFDRPTVIAVLDATVDATDSFVRDLHTAVALLPRSTDLILAFVDNDADRIAEAVGQAVPGEIILTSARSLARDCGVAVFPSVIFCNADGTVADFIIGRNNDPRSVVIQKAIALK